VFGSSSIGGSIAANLSNTRQTVDVVKARLSYLIPIH
jgi:hypothetical protein